MSDGMIEFGDTWIRASFIEAIRPIDRRDAQSFTSFYGVRVVMISGRFHTHWVDEVAGEATAYRHEDARRKRSHFLGVVLDRMAQAMRD